MSNEKIDHAALVAEIRDTMKRQEWLPALLGIRAADALEAAQQTPAVDRGQLVNALGVALANAYDDDSVVIVEESVAVQLFASGILQDAAEVEARGLERLIERVTDDGLVQVFGGERFVSVALLVSEARAQQVREGKA